MDISLETIEVWQFDGDIEPLDFIRALRCLIAENDIVVFGMYEPTPDLIAALRGIGARDHAHLLGFFTSFDANRSEHPHGCAFEFQVGDSPFADLLALDPSILKQNDIPSFFDHFIAYRPGRPMIPLISFHDAACGGTLYLSGLYAQEEAEQLAKALNVICVSVENPVLANRSRSDSVAM